jgi:signal transduction protein with GAF and PtsI domain
LLAHLDEIRRVLDQTASALGDDQRDEYRRLRDALESLDRRIREILAE